MYDCICNSGSCLRDAVGSLKKRTRLPLERYIPKYIFSLHVYIFAACKKAKHAVSRWYRTVYIPWLVTSYDTQKGKHWQNSNPQATEADYNLVIFLVIEINKIIFLFKYLKNLLYIYETNLCSIISCNNHGLEPKKQKHKYN